jgi:hypothetical protein
VGFEVGNREPALGASGVTNFDGWKAMVARTTPDRPVHKTPAEMASMRPAERRAYKLARRRYNQNWGPVRTATFEAHLTAAMDYQQSTEHVDPDGTRPGLGFSGQSGCGKTTLLHQASRTYWHQRRRELADTLDDRDLFLATGASFAPVCMITLTTGCTPKNLLRAICRFYGIKYRQADDIDSLAEQILEYVKIAATSALFIDELHNLNVQHLSAQATSGWIKWLQDNLGLRIIYAGIAIDTLKGLYEGLPADQHVLAQTASRQGLRNVTIIPKREWAGVLALYDQSIVLGNHNPGDLKKEKPGDILAQSDEISLRTGRFFNALDSLVRQGCIRATRTGVEKLTPEILAGVTLGKAVEDAYRAQTAAGYTFNEEEF